jgi:hypothetical protein
VPLALNDTGTTLVNTPLPINILANDSDVNTGQTIFVSNINGIAIVTGTDQSIPVSG